MANARVNVSGRQTAAQTARAAAQNAAKIAERSRGAQSIPALREEVAALAQLVADIADAIDGGAPAT